MAKLVEVPVRVAGLREFQEFIVSAGDMIRAYDAIPDIGDSSALGLAVDGMRAAILGLVTDDT